MRLLGKVFETTRGKYYFYDTITNKIFEISRLFYENFDGVLKQIEENYDKLIPPYINNESLRNEISAFINAIQSGVIGENNLKKTEYAFDFGDYANALNTSLHHMILGLTEECNLRCEYCTYSGHYRYARKHTSRNMSLETALKAVNFLKAHSIHSKEVAVSFYGGEPLMCFGEIVEIVAYAEAQFEGRSHHFQITTNGTLLNDSFIAWFIEHRNVFVNVTLNGGADSHNRFRRYPDGTGSHKQILKNVNKLISKCHAEDIDRINFLCNYINTDDLENIMNFFENSSPIGGKIPLLVNQVNPFDNDGFLEKYHIPASEGDTRSRLVGKYISELNTHRDRITFLKNFFDKKLYNIYMREMRRLDEEVCYFGVCTPFLTRMFVNTDGTFQICEKVQFPFDFGNVTEGFNLRQITQMLDLYQKNNNDCLNCWAVRMCQACYYNTFTDKGANRQRRLDACQNIKKSLLDSFALYSEIMEKDENLLAYLRKYEFAASNLLHKEQKGL